MRSEDESRGPSGLARLERPMADEVVGEVKAYQACDL